MKIGEIIQGVLHSEIFAHLKEKGVDIAHEASAYLSKIAGRNASRSHWWLCGKSKWAILKSYIEGELKKLKLQILKYVIIGIVITNRGYHRYFVAYSLKDQDRARILWK